MKNTRVLLASRPVGLPKNENWQIETVEAGQPGDGEFLAEVLYISLDPAMRGWIKEGKSYLTISVGCTGGKHRSVVVANELGGALKGPRRHVTVSHRDLDRP